MRVSQRIGKRSPKPFKTQFDSENSCRDILTLMQTCRKCKVEKEVKSFHRSKQYKSGYRTICKVCAKIEHDNWRSVPGNRRKEKISLHGLTVERYNKLLESQDFRCAICKIPQEGIPTFNIDHDHVCCPGVFSCGSCVRGLLCMQCNTGIGNLRESVEVMTSAIAYLNKRAVV